MLPTNDTSITQYKDPTLENTMRMREILLAIKYGRRNKTLSSSQEDAYIKELQGRMLKDGGAEALLKHGVITETTYMKILERRANMIKLQRQQELEAQNLKAKQSDYTKSVFTERSQMRNQLREKRLERDRALELTVYTKPPEPKIRISKLPKNSKKPFYPQDMVSRAYNKMEKQQKMEIVQYTPPRVGSVIVVMRVDF